MPEFHFGQLDGKMRLVGQSVQSYPAWAAKQKEGTFWLATFTPLGARPSRKQLGYYYAAVIPAVIAHMKEMGMTEVGYQTLGSMRVPIGITADNVDRYLKSLYAHSEGLEVESLRKSRMSKEQMATYLDWILGWGQENGIPIPHATGKFDESC